MRGRLSVPQRLAETSHPGVKAVGEDRGRQGGKDRGWLPGKIVGQGPNSLGLGQSPVPGELGNVTRYLQSVPENVSARRLNSPPAPQLCVPH